MNPLLNLNVSLSIVFFVVYHLHLVKQIQTDVHKFVLRLFLDCLS